MKASTFHILIGAVASAMFSQPGLTQDTIGTSPPAQSAVITPASTGRTTIDFDSDWRFRQGDFASAPMPAFDDADWRRIELPHDWSSEGPFGPEFASGTGYAPGGIGWYRKHFRLDSSEKGKVAAIEFDGIYNHAQVWLNGHFVGGRPYGYSSFECDLTPHLRFGSNENVIAVRADHSRFADSRWYTGSGIYRHVRLRLTAPVRIAPWGTFVTTPKVTAGAATVRVETEIENGTASTEKFSLLSELIAAEGKVAASLTSTGELPSSTNSRVVQTIELPQPQLWSPETPRLYNLRTRLTVGSTMVDETQTAFGVRSIRFDADKGFFLNETPMKLKGVCVHHEAGCLGAAVPAKVWERRLRTLKEVGVNAIRTSHNPPAPEFLDLCDRLGLLVKDEAFDEFTPAKNKWVTGRNDGLPARFGYAEEFGQWSVRDISDMVRRDRNHPSIIMWSIGNEIDYANDPFSHPVLGADYHADNPPAENLVEHARPLIATVKALDRTRPVTAALANVAMSDAVGFGELLDVVGYNYQETRYRSDHVKFPHRVIFGSETSHQAANWAVVRDHDYVLGQFLWTGIDYLGEANRWPNRGSAAGLLDLCGFKKPLAWFRQSLWSDQPMVHLCVSSGDGSGRRGRIQAEESWNWPSNTTVTVRCYTTCPEVRLSLNGKVIGNKRLADAIEEPLSWAVRFEPGVLTAVGQQGEKVKCEFKLRTAGTARRIELLPDINELRADGRDVAHVEFRVVDAEGVRVPDATNSVTFNLAGPAQLLGIENGNLFDSATGKGPSRQAFRGRGLAILQSRAAAGKVTLTATSPGLESTTVELNSHSN